MDMIAIRSHVFKLKLVAFGNCAGDFLNCFRYMRIQKRLAVFDRKDDVIVSIICTVVTLWDAHHFSLSENQRFPETLLSGNPPAELEGIGFAIIQKKLQDNKKSPPEGRLEISFVELAGVEPATFPKGGRIHRIGRSPD